MWCGVWPSLLTYAHTHIAGHCEIEMGSEPGGGGTHI